MLHVFIHFSIFYLGYFRSGWVLGKDNIKKNHIWEVSKPGMSEDSSLYDDKFTYILKIDNS
jgi:hypothetical protein